MHFHIQAGEGKAVLDTKLHLPGQWIFPYAKERMFALKTIGNELNETLVERDCNFCILKRLIAYYAYFKRKIRLYKHHPLYCLQL